MISFPRHEPMTKFRFFFRGGSSTSYWMILDGADWALLIWGEDFLSWSWFWWLRFCGPKQNPEMIFSFFNFAGYGSLRSSAKPQNRSLVDFRNVWECATRFANFCVFSPILSEDLVDFEARAVLRTIPSRPIEPNFATAPGKEWRICCLCFSHGPLFMELLLNI